MFPVYSEKCLSRKAIQPWWQTFRWWRRGRNGGAEVAETKVKKLLICGFWRTGIAMRQVYQCWSRICRVINVFFRLEYHMFYICDLFTSCPSYIQLLQLSPSLLVTLYLFHCNPLYYAYTLDFNGQFEITTFLNTSTHTTDMKNHGKTNVFILRFPPFSVTTTN
jgi:hypothetical protein